MLVRKYSTTVIEYVVLEKVCEEVHITLQVSVSSIGMILCNGSDLHQHAVSQTFAKSNAQKMLIYSLHNNYTCLVHDSRNMCIPVLDYHLVVG